MAETHSSETRSSETDSSETDSSMTTTAVTDTVNQALGLLHGLEDRSVTEHVEVFDTVHRTLQDALATLDEV